jgi:signal transduction histidine kinase
MKPAARRASPSTGPITGDPTMRRGVRAQLLVPPLLLLLGVGGVSALAAWSSAGLARRNIETRVRGVAQNLAEEGYPLTRNILVQMKRLSGADFLVVPRSGEPVSTLAEAPQTLPPPESLTSDWQTLTLGPPVAVGDKRYLCSGIRLTRPPRSGEVLYIFYPEALWRDALWGAVWPDLAVGGGVGVASVALAVVLGRRLSRRLGELERRTRQIADGDFRPMPLPAGDDEVRDLARSVNEMAARLALLQETVQRTERLRLLGQVSGGLAHQLRNGLTGARLAVQLFLEENAGAADAEPLRVALRQLALLEAHLKRFLDLGRSDAAKRGPCDVAALVTEAVELLGPQCRHAGIALSWEAPKGGRVVEGDAGRLGQLLVNLLGNAVEAAGPGGQVEVRLESCSGGVTLEVWDSGPGPAPEVAARLFEPFVTGKPEGVGLGLAVARQVAEAHGGRIGWERRDGRTCFRVELPAPPPA